MRVIMRLKEIEKEAKKEEIMDTARKLFSKKGFEHTSMEEIAQKVKIAKGTIYLYFPSKYALLIEIIEFAKKGMLNQAKIICSDKNLSFFDKIRGMIKIYLDFVKKYPEYPIIFRSLQDLKEDIRQKIIEMLKKESQEDPGFLLLQEIFKEGIAKKEIREDINIAEETCRIWFFTIGFSTAYTFIQKKEFQQHHAFLAHINVEKILWDSLEIILNTYRYKGG